MGEAEIIAGQPLKSGAIAAPDCAAAAHGLDDSEYCSPSRRG